jgi:hypothetical protein
VLQATGDRPEVQAVNASRTARASGPRPAADDHVGLEPRARQSIRPKS